MISSEVQRTLVKSPPELWAELSDPAALARHLAELGEIRIVEAKPEQSVQWEAKDAKGRAELQPSGWGTKVTLAITREMPESPRADDPEPAEPACSIEQADPVVEAETGSEPEPEVRPELEVRPEPEVAPEPRVELEPRLGFFARLFRRRARTEPVRAAASEPRAAAEPEITAAPDVEAEVAPARQAEPDQPNEDLAAELAAAEEAIAAASTELLSAVLDRLGSAHHRPFSRA
jgi:hypothetical protein